MLMGIKMRHIIRAASTQTRTVQVAIVLVIIYLTGATLVGAVLDDEVRPAARPELPVDL